MIIRSGLIRKRDHVDFTQFSEHWRHLHGPLALQVASMRAYRQNHILARRPSPHAALLHSVDGISQLWFDDIDSMLVAMDSAEQRTCVGDLRLFLDRVTIVVQQQGDTRQHGNVEDLSVQDQRHRIAHLDRPLLVLHSPRDEVVGIESAGAIFQAARHSKSFVSLDTADPLLTKAEDAEYAATMIAAWVSRFVPVADPVSG